MAQNLLDDAIFYYNECVKYDSSIEIKNIIDNNLGIIYTDKKEYKLAEKYLLESLKSTDSSDFYNLSISYINLADLYSEMKDYEKAHPLFLKADECASKIDDKPSQLESKIGLITSFTNIKDYASAKRYIKVWFKIDSYVFVLVIMLRFHGCFFFFFHQPDGRTSQQFL